MNSENDPIIQKILSNVSSGYAGRQANVSLHKDGFLG
jgi:hypothetical protein